VASFIHIHSFDDCCGGETKPILKIMGLVSANDASVTQPKSSKRKIYLELISSMGGEQLFF
jgi:hypothetical protein